MALRVRMQEIMTAKVGIFRRGNDLEEAVAELQQLLVRSRNIGVRDTLRGREPRAGGGLPHAHDAQGWRSPSPTARYTRTESRGAHFREDYPRRDDSQWLKRTLATWKDENATLPTLAYEPLDVKRMELPPGWRGYGTKNHIDHPDTPIRQQEVDAVRARMPAGEPHRGAGRTDALRAPAAAALPRPQRTRRRAAGRAAHGHMSHADVGRRSRCHRPLP